MGGKKLTRERSTLHGINPLDNLGKGIFPRIFRKNLLERTFEEIEKINADDVFAYDDFILFAISSKFSKRVGYLNESLYHIEEKGIIELINHRYNIGKSAKITNRVNTICHIKNNSITENIIKSIKHRYFLSSLIKKFSFELGYVLN